MSVALGACSSPKRDAAANTAACNALSKTLADQEQIFVTQAQTIRAEHVVLTEEVAGCSGQQLEDLRRRAQEEMSNLRDYLKDFNRALKTDPDGVYIDTP